MRPGKINGSYVRVGDADLPMTDYEIYAGFQDLHHYLKVRKPPIMGWTPDCKYPVVYAERGRAVYQVYCDRQYTIEFILSYPACISNEEILEQIEKKCQFPLSV